MSAATIDRRVADRDHADRDRRSWYWALVEALAYAGAALDPGPRWPPPAWPGSASRSWDTGSRDLRRRSTDRSVGWDDASRRIRRQARTRHGRTTRWR